jgi:threonine dehydrogenase-like Zn-dependent dehydrogenase
VARVLIVGCGCRGQALARAVRAEGHAVRATSRTEERRAAIEATGAEFHRGDPDRIGTLTYALDNATILCWLMGSATGDPERVAALHGTRLKMLLERTIDTTVRGVVYEAAGTVAPELLAAGASTVREACRYSEIPFAVVSADPADHGSWLEALSGAVFGLLGHAAPLGRPG